MKLIIHYRLPLKGDRLIVPSGCNTAAPELHLRPAVAKSPSTLDAFSGSAHQTPLAKGNDSPPANSHHLPYDCLRLSSMHYSWLSRFFFCNFFIQCRSFYFDFDASAASVCIFVLWLDFSWVSYVTSMPRRPLNHQLNNNNNKRLLAKCFYRFAPATISVNFFTLNWLYCSENCKT